MKKPLSCLLAVSIVLLSPGLSAYAGVGEAGAPEAGPLEALPPALPAAAGALPADALPTGAPDAGLELPAQPQAPQPAPALPAAPAALPGETARPAPAPLAQAAKPGTKAPAAARLARLGAQAAKAAQSGPGAAGSQAAASLGAAYDGSKTADASSDAVPAAGWSGGGASLPPSNAGGGSQGSVPPGPWASRSPRVGLSYTGPKYLFMRAASGFFDWVNRYKPWYELPRFIGVLNLAAIEMRMRLVNIFNPNAYKSTAPRSTVTAAQLRAQDPAGRGHDPAEPEMGAAQARFNRVSKPERHGGAVPSEIAKMVVDASDKLDKRERFVPAKILNVHAAFWIQFMVHDWMNHARAPIADNPHKIALKDGHPLGQKEMTLDRTAEDPARPAGAAGAPVYTNTETHWWDLSPVYGSTQEILQGLRTFSGGRMKVAEDGRLAADPAKEGVDRTGFNSNYSTGLSVLHTLFTKEHNSIAQALAAEHPDWTDQQLFEKARTVNVALAAKIHTVEWTRALLPNPTLHEGMWADWYGFLGKRAKLWLMTRVYPRHPFIAKLLHPLRYSEYLSGVPGTHYDHFTGPFAMPEEFVEVYRMHPLLPDQYVIKSAADGRVLGELDLTRLQGKHTRDVTGKYRWEDLIASFGGESAGALVLNNFPETLRSLVDMEGRKLDMSVLDMFRLRERAPELTFNEFRRRIGMRPAKDFLDLTGGDKALADKISQVYGGDIEKVDLQIGLRAVPKPAGFAISDEAFRIFILMAPRRLKSDRFLSELYNPGFYTPLGFDWVEHNNMRSIVARHHPELRAALEGLENFFAPWPNEGPQKRLYAEADAASTRMVKRSAASAGLLALLAGAAVAAGHAAVLPAVVLSGAALVAVTAAGLMRLSALGELEHAIKYADTDASQAFYGPVYHAEAVGRRGALLARAGGLLAGGAGAVFAYGLLASTHPLLAAAAGAAAALLGLRASSAAKRFSQALALARISVYSQLKDAEPSLDETWPGATALERHGRYFADGGELVTLWGGYAQLRKLGLPRTTSFMTALLAQLTFGRKSQRNMPAEARRRLEPGFFNIWAPGLVDAQAAGNSRIWAHEDLPGGVKHGDVDPAQLDRLFRRFAVGRDYLTAYDLERMRQANLDRDEAALLKRLVGNLASKRSFAQLLEVGADRVVWEDDKYGKLVPAISRKRVRELFEGSALWDIARERAQAKP